jgi:hypothetical protein
MHLGQTYRWNLRSKTHLWVIISDPQQNPDQVLTVSFTTFEKGKDSTCVIKETEFPGGLSHESCIHYVRSEVTSLKTLEKNRDTELITLGPVAPGNVLRKVQQGFLVSKDVEGYKKAILKRQAENQPPPGSPLPA